MTTHPDSLETAFMLNFIKEVCDKVGPRPGFTPEEAKGAEFIRQQFLPHSDETAIESFSVRAAPFLLDFKVTPIFYLAGLFCLFIIPVITVALMGVLIASLLLENIWNIRFNYAFGKKKQSQNVIAKVHPKAERKALIILGGTSILLMNFP